MAEGTRLRDLSEHVNSLEERFQQMSTEYKARMEGLAQQIAEVKNSGQRNHEAIQVEANRKHEELLKLLSIQPPPLKPMHGGPPPEYHIPEGSGSQSRSKEAKGKGILPIPLRQQVLEEDMTPHWETKNHNHALHLPYPKLEFSSFSSEDPRGWLENCAQYFELYQIPPQQWLGIATMHLVGRAKVWKQGYFANKITVTWEEFYGAICRRFSQMGERYLIRELNNLRQTRNVERYQERFEELRSQLLHYDSQLTEEHFISCYINGLKEDLVPFLDIAHPVTLEEAYEQATLHEKALAVINKRGRFTPIAHNNRTQPTAPTERATEPNKPQYLGQQRHLVNQPQISRQLWEQRRAAGQCFRCGEKYFPGHVCTKKSLNQLQAVDEVVEIYDEGCLLEEVKQGLMDTEEQQSPLTEGELQEIGVSVHALSGEKQQDTIKIQGEVKNKTLTILIDTGSTHSFIDLQVAKEVKTHVETAPPLVVTVANGQKVLSKLKRPDFSWHMQGQEFRTELRVIRLEGSSIVLGIDWLKSYGKVTFDFQRNSVTIIKEGHELELQGMREGVKLKFISAAQWCQEADKGECFLISEGTLAESPMEGEALHPHLKQLLEQYKDVFEEPKKLPPKKVTRS